MAALLKYTSRRTPLQNAILTFIVVIVGMLLAGAIPTQWWAWKYHYDLRLGQPLFRLSGFALYQPLQWVIWGWKYGDVLSLRSSVHTMFLIAGAAEVGAMISGGFIGYKLANYSKGMEGLHGTAHFAERDDVDKTGFIDAPGHKADGVIVGSVMLDRKGKVIHPHHPKFDKRYEPIMIRGKWPRFRKIPKRDGNKRPMFQLRKTIVKKVEILRDGGNTHIFGFCPTRSGKGVGMVVPTLLTWRHSVMVNDPKGEAYALSAGFRSAAGQTTIKFEPACTDGTGACWNPLDEIRIFTLRDVADAQMIMTMACDPKGKGLDDYFDKAGYEFLTAVALHVRYTSPEGSLAACANYLGDPNWDSDKQMYTEMMQATHDPEGKMGWKDSFGNSTKTHPMIANAAKTMLNKEDKDRSGVLSTAKSLLSLYLDPIVANNTNRSDFLVRDLMTGEKPVSLYFVVNPPDMERLTPLTRLFYAIFIRRNAAEMEFEGGRSRANYTHPLLMIIDEAASLQKLPILQEALGYVAGYGIRMFFLVQDIVQIEELYGDKQSFDSGAETRIAYAPNKIETAEKLARMTGKTTVTEEGASTSQSIIGIKGGNVSVSTNKTARDLVTADEFMVLHDQDMIVFVKGQPPIYGRKAFYYENPTLMARAAMPPPKESARLRGSPKSLQAENRADDTVEIREATPETPQDKWAAGREAMRERIAVAAQPQGTGQVAAKQQAADARPETLVGAQSDSEESAKPRQRSRYADQIKTITPEERRQVEELVASVGVVNKVISVSAF
ncbi:type IV secretory system conjugative DNA transfer family protein [Cupriavidus nantongensis]|uniref:Conjugal transfer protein TraG n=1 Tax=Cupriavidus nantongensis TaxID=1796606 RepID=A0A142JIM4_9BURK|nr:type IV secretory system conjugative DNA transfer family protein [Cupriavidus nantongensis]AMR77936.1 hypothetical protein A2G96_09390 [Cupriavidus nantongensis]